MPQRQIPSRILSSPRKLPRALAMVLLGLQALLWGGGSIIEARAAAESLSRYSHVEDQGSTTCPPIHSHLDCLICRTLTGGAASGSAPSMVATIAGACERPVLGAFVVLDQGRIGSLGSRAPPIA